MQQFDLSLWLQNKSRKIRTGDGRPVRIICIDRKGKSGNIVGLVGKDESHIYVWNNDGKHIVSEIPDNDLFFTDEEEKLTEFEKTMIQFSHERNSLIQFEHTTDEVNAHLYRYSEKLLDLARKKLELELDKKLKEAYNQGGLDTQEEITKCLPKWKKDSNNLSSLIYALDNRGDGKILLCRKGYAININELLNLPKEE